MPQACSPFCNDHAYHVMTINAKRPVHRRRVGPYPARPVSRKRRQRALAADRNRRITAGPSRSDRSARAAALPLNRRASLIVVLLLSLGLWAAIWGAVASLASACWGNRTPCAAIRPGRPQQIGSEPDRIPLLGQYPHSADEDRRLRRPVHGRGDVEDIGAVPTPFTPACDGQN